MKCDYCGHEHSPNDVFVDMDGKIICLSCISENNLAVCAECKRVFNAKNGEVVCNECSDKVYEKIINPYSTKPNPVFTNQYGKTGDRLRYYGTELELSCTKASLVFNLFRNEYKNKLMLNKSDSSLCDGVEINISPMDKKTLFNFLDRNKERMKMLINSESYDNAGIHIHVNRNSLTPQDILKLSYLINLRTEESKIPFFSYLCGRTKNYDKFCGNPNYCSIASKNSMSSLLSTDKRHVGFNVRPKETVEFRMFKSSLDVDTIKSYIYIVDSLIEFVHNNPLNRININNYLLFLRLKRYDTDYLKERVKKLNEHYNVRDTKINNYSIDSWYELFRGINWSHYNNIVGRLFCEYSRINKEVINLVLGNKSYIGYRWNTTLTNNKVLDKMLDTYKKTMISIIIRKEQELCA